MGIMTGTELARRCAAISKLPTAYIFGGIGELITTTKLNTKLGMYAKNAPHVKKAEPLTGIGYMFDCVCMIKAVLWGWTQDRADRNKVPYATNGVPDVNADGMIKLCKGVSTDFSGDIPVGAALWMSGHIGVYIGDGLGVECTPAFDRGVQVTAVGNLGKRVGYPTRTWSKWGLLPWVDYSPNQIRVIFNGREVYLPGKFSDDTNHISGTVREIFGALGAEISADGTTPIITLK